MVSSDLPRILHVAPVRVMRGVDESSRSMAPTQQSFHFVEVTKPGEKFEVEQLRGLRTHVRRAIVRNKESQPLEHSLKLVTASDVLARGKGSKNDSKSVESDKNGQQGRYRIKPVKNSNNRFAQKGITKSKEVSSSSSGGSSIDPSATKCHPGLPPDRNKDCRTEEQGYEEDPGILLNPPDYHPFTSYASNTVQLPIKRLDELFKSDAFRIAGEPLFDTSQVDSNRNIDRTFPQCLARPVFMHALVYSMLQIANRNNPTVETLYLESKTISHVNAELSQFAANPSPSLVGAVMLLKASAYRFDEVHAHATHSDGLTRLIELFHGQSSQSRLTPAAMRAAFWLDLFSSILLDSKRQLSHLSLPIQPCWTRSNFPHPELFSPYHLPAGFVRHRKLIPDDLLDCVQDVVELQSRMRDPVYRADFRLIDDMQASIESRLAFQGKACRLFGDLAEMARLAIFICTYCCWTDTWNSFAVPAKVASLLARRLHSFLGMSVDWTGTENNERFAQSWEQVGDLLLWLVLVGASVAQNERELVPGLKSSYAKIIRRLSDLISAPGEGESCCWPTMLAMMEQDYIDCKGWMKNRLQIREWFTLEITIQATAAPED